MAPEVPHVSYPFWISVQNQLQGCKQVELVESYLENLNSEIVALEMGKRRTLYKQWRYVWVSSRRNRTA